VDPSFLEIPLCQADRDDIHARNAILFTAGSLQLPHIAEPLQQFVSGGFRQIQSVWPNVELFVLGRNAPAKVARVLAAEPGVRLVDWVEDFSQALKGVDIAIFLDKSGSGIKTRVLQALAAGKPVVGTPIALEGIQVTNEVNAFICESLDEVAEVVLKLLRDAELRMRLGCAARELVGRQCTPEVVGRQWEALYARAMETARNIG